MDLFEEALRRWEEALTFRSRQGEDDASCASVKTGAGDAIAEQSMEVNTRIKHSNIFNTSSTNVTFSTITLTRWKEKILSFLMISVLFLFSKY